MPKLRINKLTLKFLIMLSVGLITLALLTSCIDITQPTPSEVPTRPPEAPSAPTETPPTVSETSPMPTESPPTQREVPSLTTPPVPSEIPTTVPEDEKTAEEMGFLPPEKTNGTGILYSPGPGFDIFMDIAGIDGESTDDAHDNWIDVLSYSHGVSLPGSSELISGITRSAGRSEHQAFSIVKTLDKTSPKLYLYCSSGTHIPEITIELSHAGEDKQKYMEYTFTDVIIASVSVSGSTNSAQEKPVEEVTFNYRTIRWTYTETDPLTGKAKGDVSATWDIETNTGS